MRQGWVKVSAEACVDDQPLSSFRGSEAHYRALMQSALDAIVTADSVGRIVGWNQSAERTFGYTEAEILGKPLTLLMPERYRERHTEGLRRILSGGLPQVIGRIVELEGLSKDAREFPIELSLSQWETGEGRFFTGFIRDITVRKQAERDLIRKNEELNRILVQLSSAKENMIKQERLSALGRMAGGIAHDFNNMLMPIVGLSEMLLLDTTVWDNRDEVISMLTTIHTAGRDAASIVKRLREFYQPDADLETGVIDVDVLFRDVAMTTRPAWKVQKESESKPIHLIHDVERGLKVTGNRSQLKEALTNVVLNAVDAMPEGGTLTLSGHEIENAWLLAVTDTGSGMPPHVVERCIEPFFSTKGEKGTGIGLAMVHGIAERHGGSLDIQSEVGRGTTITIKLPRIEQTASRHADQNSETLRPMGSLTILVVDDEERARRLLRRLLQYAGHQVQIAEEMGAALTLFDQVRIDLVITDRAMPGGSGDELAHALRQRGATIPIILLTGLGEAMLYRHETPPGVDLVLSKPIGTQELMDGIQRVLTRR